MKFIQYLQLQKIYEADLSLQEGVLLTTINQYINYSESGVCKMSYQYIADKVLNCSGRTALRIVKNLQDNKWIYVKTGKYEDRKKQEANIYTLSPKCIKLFSTDKMSAPSTVKMSVNINKYKEEDTGFSVPGPLRPKYLELVKNFGEEYAKETITRYININKNNDTK